MGGPASPSRPAGPWPAPPGSFPPPLLPDPPALRASCNPVPKTPGRRPGLGATSTTSRHCPPGTAQLRPLESSLSKATSSNYKSNVITSVGL